MVPTDWITAMVLLNERGRDAERAAVHHRLEREAQQATADRRAPAHPALSLLAGMVRRFGDATHAVSMAACSAATRIEGRSVSGR